MGKVRRTRAPTRHTERRPRPTGLLDARTLACASVRPLAHSPARTVARVPVCPRPRASPASACPRLLLSASLDPYASSLSSSSVIRAISSSTPSPTRARTRHPQNSEPRCAMPSPPRLRRSQRERAERSRGRARPSVSAAAWQRRSPARARRRWRTSSRIWAIVSSARITAMRATRCVSTSSNQGRSHASVGCIARGATGARPRPSRSSRRASPSAPSSAMKSGGSAMRRGAPRGRRASPSARSERAPSPPRASTAVFCGVMLMRRAHNSCCGHLGELSLSISRRSSRSRGGALDLEAELSSAEPDGCLCGCGPPRPLRPAIESGVGPYFEWLWGAQHCLCIAHAPHGHTRFGCALAASPRACTM